jgi:hypothetical protein
MAQGSSSPSVEIKKIAGVAPDVNTGAGGAGTLRVQLANESLAALENITVSVSGVSLNAGTNNIGDVDIVTVPAPLNVTGTGTEASALRVTLATDSTGVLSIDDNGSTLSIDDGGGVITVDGTVAVTDNSSSLTVDAPVATPVFVRLSNGSIAVDTVPVTLTSTTISSISAGDNNIGNVDVVTLPSIPVGSNNTTNTSKCYNCRNSFYSN